MPADAANAPATADAANAPATVPVTVEPAAGEPAREDDHERMSHIVLEGFRPEEGDFVPAGPSVVEGMVNGTAVRALCGKIWVPDRDPRRYPICPTCREVAERMGWRVPA